MSREQQLRDRICVLEAHRAQWRRVAFRYRDALEAIEGGHVCDEGHREEARRALWAISDTHPVEVVTDGNGADSKEKA